MLEPKPRDRLLNALRGSGGPGAAVIPYPSIFLRDHWEEVTDQPWWHEHYGTFAQRTAALEAMARTTGSDWIHVGECPSADWRERHEVVVRDGDMFLRESGTGEMQALSRPPVSGRQYQSSLVPSRVRSIEDVARCIPVTPSAERDAAGRLDFIRHVKAHLGDRFCVVAAVPGPLWVTHGLFGFTAMMTNLIEKPELVETAVRRIADEQIQRVGAYARAGVDCVWIEDCMTSADLISREHFQRFHAPRVKEIVARITAAGMNSVYYFCGDPWDRLEDILGTGADAVSFEESKKGFQIDIEDLVGAVGGRAVVLGNLDAVGILEAGSPGDLRREVARQLAAGRRNGSFIASLGSPVTPATPVERVRQFTDWVRELSIA